MKLPDPSMLLKPVDPALYHRRPLSVDDAVRLRYLGTAGFELVQMGGEERVLVVDPFVTRPGLIETATKPLVPNTELIAEILPRADDVLIGHAHHDHILDAPELCRRTGARMIGSPSTVNVGRAAGLPESQLVLTTGRERIRSGDAVVEGLPSRHGRVYFNRVTLPGSIDAPPKWPARFRDLRHGLVLNWYIEMGGLKIVHVDSADFIEDELADHECDVLCLCAIGRAYRPGYTQTIIRMLKPRLVVACHWDYFFLPYRAEQKCLPGVDLPGFCEEIRAAGAQPVVLPFDGELGVKVAR